ncbi:MAG: hypothetical protein KatS3mg110_2364 [Pirellulaceae bacterium]|nr:MAG: hypothetical protein KatS3mg110_2364 [Pirellulaceae bacterium]
MTESLAVAIRQAIQSNPYLHGKQLTFHFEGDRLVLHGRVYSYFQKQMAQEAVRRVEGAPRIDNQLEVVRHDPERLVSSSDTLWADATSPAR